MPTARTLKLGAATLLAATTGVGTAVGASLIGTPVPAGQTITVDSRTTFTRTVAFAGQTVGMVPSGGTVDWGEEGEDPEPYDDVLCPVDRSKDCALVGSHAYPRNAAGGTSFYTITHSVTWTNEADGSVLTTGTAYQQASVGSTPQVEYAGEHQLDFPATRVGETSAPVTLTLSNAAQADDAFNLAGAFGGRDAGDFLVTAHDCTAVLPGDDCTVQVAFRPSATGAREADLLVDAGHDVVEVVLAGTGLDAAPPPTTTVTQTQTVTQPRTTTTTERTVTVAGPERTITIQGPPAAAPRCIVPALRGKTLAQATSALEAANCALGTVRRPRRARTALVVASQTVRAGTRRRAGAKVGVRLARRPAKQARARR